MVQSLFESLTTLEQNADALATRLHPMLEAEQNIGGDKSSYAFASYNVPHVEQLETINARLNWLIGRTSDLLNRLAV